MESKISQSDLWFQANRIFYLAAMAIFAMTIAGCSQKKETETQAETHPAPSEFHADYDIAMTIRSVADAIRVGEPLDSTEYDYEGVLTDGLGHPLYTDLQGAPGEWQIDVTTPTSVVIRNIYLGDLLPKDLENYLASSMDLSIYNLVTTREFDDDDDSELTVYNFDGGYLRFEVRNAIAPNGIEGPLMSIVATKEPPSDSKQNYRKK